LRTYCRSSKWDLSARPSAPSGGFVVVAHLVFSTDHLSQETPWITYDGEGLAQGGDRALFVDGSQISSVRQEAARAKRSSGL
jgi:hypothetical protein